jgi:hypothetical protein
MKEKNKNEKLEIVRKEKKNSRALRQAQDRQASPKSQSVKYILKGEKWAKTKVSTKS